MGISRTAFSFVIGGVLSLVFGGAPPLRAAAIYFCTNQDGVNPGAIYQAGAGDENYSLVATLPGCAGPSEGSPNGGSIAINSQGNIFQADTATGDIYEITPSGAVSTFASGLTTGGNGLLNLAFDSSGNLFVADQTAAAIYEYTPGGVQSTFYSGEDPSLGLGHNLQPGALAVDANGNVFVSGGGGIDEITPGGSASLFSSSLGGADQLAFDGGTLFGTVDYNGDQGSLFEYAANGTPNLYAKSTGYDFTFDSSGNAYYDPPSNLTIYEIPAGGGPSTAFSTRIFADPGPLVAEESTPEPGTFSLLFAGAGFALLSRRRPTSARS